MYEMNKNLIAEEDAQPPLRDPYDDVYDASGWLLFSAAMIFFVGLWNVFEGVIALFSSAFFTGTPVFGSLAWWGIAWIAIGVVEMALAYGITTGSNIARWIAVVVVGFGSLVHLLSVPLYPWWSLFVLAIDLVILYGLLVHFGPRRGAAGKVTPA